MQSRHRLYSAIMPLVAAILVSGAAYAYHSTPDVDIVQGKKVYMGTCVACHGANGAGQIPGVPDFTKSQSPLSKPNDVLLEHTTKGFRSEGSMLSMPPKGGNPSLTEEDLKAVIAYMHEAFAH